ncbi:hypothetical protein Lal_00002004, partial [Lupinus albus]
NVPANYDLRPECEQISHVDCSIVLWLSYVELNLVFSVFSLKDAGVLLASGDIDPKLEYGVLNHLFPPALLEGIGLGPGVVAGGKDLLPQGPAFEHQEGPPPPHKDERALEAPPAVAPVLGHETHPVVGIAPTGSRLRQELYGGQTN